MKVTSVSERLKELMQFYGISQSDIVKKTGIGKSTLSQYVTGTRNPKADFIYDICNAYHLNEAWLLGYDIDMFKISNMESTPKPDKVTQYAELMSKLPQDKQDWLFKTIEMLIETESSKS